jgi:endonuclease-3
MAKSRTDFEQVIDLLERHYGRPEPPSVTAPLEMILHENVAYLVSDERRAAAFDALRSRVGTGPVEILTAPEEVLHEVAALGGMRPQDRVERLRRIAQIALQEFEGDLSKVLREPLPAAKKALMRFPAIGEPGAEKILLFSRSQPVLALDSNGLRALVRIGFGQQAKSYSATYRSVRNALKDEARSDYDFLIRAHQLLRRHGQELCRSAEPACRACPLTSLCAYYRQAAHQPLDRRRP